MNTGNVLFYLSIALNCALLVSMFHRGLWRSHQPIVLLQILLFLEIPLFLLSGPRLYACLWPTFDKANIVLLLIYARCCCEDFAEVSVLLALCIVLKLCAWADVDPEQMYVANPYHYFRIYADLTATIVFIWAIHRRKGARDAEQSKPASGERTYRAESAPATSSTA